VDTVRGIGFGPDTLEKRISPLCKSASGFVAMMVAGYVGVALDGFEENQLLSF